jgi:hypothetical protein
MSEVKHQPASPLPWEAGGHKPAGYGWFKAAGRTHHLSGQYEGQVQDVKYICHAAENYPFLVRALKAELAEHDRLAEENNGCCSYTAHHRERANGIRSLLNAMDEL